MLLCLFVSPRMGFARQDQGTNVPQQKHSLRRYVAIGTIEWLAQAPNNRVTASGFSEAILSRALRMAASLLPILQCRHADANH